eukprot:5005326-Amphidinium_carterae.2
MKRSAYRAEFLAVVHAVEECQPKVIVSDCKVVVKAVQALQHGRRHIKAHQMDEGAPNASCNGSRHGNYHR